MKNSYMEVSTFQERNLKATVLRTSGLTENYYGCRFYIDESSLGIEWYEGKNELYAENAAENYVLGIKKYPV
jgi:hypothetical protein